MITRTVVTKAMTGWTEKTIAESIAKDLKKGEFISGIGTTPGKVKITVKVERIRNET